MCNSKLRYALLREKHAVPGEQIMEEAGWLPSGQEGLLEEVWVESWGTSRTEEEKMVCLEKMQEPGHAGSWGPHDRFLYLFKGQ